MPKFIIETTAEAVIREFWQIEAATAEDARDSFHDGEGYQLLWDETIGDEQNREVAHVHPESDLDGVTALHRAQQAAPAMLAALQKVAGCAMAAPWLQQAGAWDDVAAAIALATGTPTAEQAPPVDMHGKRTDTWNLVPGAQPEPDEADSEGLATYRITETVTYLVKAEDEAHAERRFVCEVGISAECFHAVEGRTIELVDEADESEFTCNGCGREESECSADPCPDVIADRES